MMQRTVPGYWEYFVVLPHTPRTMARLACFVLLIAAVAPSHAQLPFHVVLNTPGQTPGMDTVLTWHATASGAFFTTSPSDSISYTVRRYGPDGQPVWSRKVSSPDLMQLLPGASFWFSMGGDGMYQPFYSDRHEGLFYCSNNVGTRLTDQSGMDTILARTAVFHLDSNANVTLAIEVVNEIIAPWADLDQNGFLANSKLAVQADGSFHVINMMRSETNNIRVAQVMRFDASGSHLWTRAYYPPGGSLSQGPLTDFGQHHHWMPDDQGGLYVDDRSIGGSFLHIDAAGNCDWARSYEAASNTDGFAMEPRYTVDPVTHDLLIGDTWGGIVAKDLVMRIDLSGTLLGVDAYDRGAFEAGPLPLPHVRPNGDVVLSYDHPYNVPLEAYSMLVPDLGGLHKRYKNNLGLNAGHLYRMAWKNSRLVGDLLYMDGHLVDTDTIWGITEVHPMFGAFDVNNVMDCLMFDTAVSYNSALSLYTTVTHPAWLSAPADSMHTITPRPVLVSPLPDLTVSDLCSTILGVTEPASPATINVLSSLLAVGDPLVLMNAEPGELTVFDADGRRVAGGIRTARQARFELSTAGWTPGLKLMQWRSSDGVRQRTMKVVLQ